MEGLITQQIFIALIGFAAGIVATLIGLVGKYLFDYKIAKRQFELEKRVTERRLELEERTSVSNVIGSSQANLARATAELYARLSNFFEAREKACNWLKPGTVPAKDGYYLREFVRRLFYFIAWGRITQDAINSLPVEVIQERYDLQRAYAFVNLSNSILTYTWLFRGLEEYRDYDESFHLFTGTLERVAELGVQTWKGNEQSIPLDAFDKLYQEESPLVNLRDFVTQLSEEPKGERSDAPGFIAARLAASHVALASFLANDYRWVIDVPEERELVAALKENLDYAANLIKDNPPLSDLVPQNLVELKARYRSKLPPIGEAAG